jgi:hypothetical protein
MTAAVRVDDKDVCREQSREGAVRAAAPRQDRSTTEDRYTLLLVATTQIVSSV